MCYYQGIEYCLEHGLAHFEPGAQGEHKIARGFSPTATHSRHLIADPAFAAALGTWCAQEREAISRYREHLSAHLHFRNVDSAGPTDRKSVVSGKRVSVRGDLGGSRIIKKKTRQTRQQEQARLVAATKEA